MKLKRVLAATAAAVVLAAGGYGGFLAHRSRHAVSVAPDGPFPVGRAVHDVADRSRTDEFAPVGGVPRVLSLWLWYPAAAPGRTVSAYAPGPWGGLHRFGFAQTDFTKINTGTYDDVPLAAGTFPLVVLLPGLGFAAPQYASIAAGLAARGYLVAGVTPTYSANLSVVSGRPVRATAAGDPSDLDGPRADRMVTVWAADARFAADQVGVLLGSHVDRTRVVYTGHSFGGAAALEACRQDESCAGAADLDGTPFGPVVTAGLERPVLLLSSGADGVDRDASAHTLAAASGGRVRAYTIAGARHFDFTDYAAYWLAGPVRRLLPLGDPRTLPIARDYLAAFLATVVRGQAWREPGVPGVRRTDMLSR